MGDPVATMLGQNATQIEIQQMRKVLGLDKPLCIQYFNFVKKICRGDFGNSYIRGRPVTRIIGERLPATVELATVSMIIAFIVGVTTGVFAAVRPRFIISRGIMLCSLLGVSLPTFLIGILLIMIFSVYLHVLPSFGRGEVVNLGFWSTGLITRSGLTHIILPAVALSLYEIAVLVRLTRGAMLEVLGEDYIRTALAKGLPSFKVIFKHALRNAFLPIITMVGLQYGELLAFTLIIATIFQWPGLGPLFLNSVYSNDQPVIVAYILVAALIIIVVNLAVDLLYGIVNPKVRYE
jgi:ABC-type dipeptide/oligopeptide/nickel transport system permease component